MAPRGMIRGAIIGAMAPVLVLAGAPQCMGEGSCANDINSLLQVSVNTGKTVSQKTAQIQAHKQEPISSLLDNTEFICWQGPDTPMRNAVAYPRGCSLAQLDSHQGLAEGRDCADRGYTQLVSSPDMCFGVHGATSFVRAGTTDAQLSDFTTHVHGLIMANTNARGMSEEMGMLWATCLPCGGGQPGEGYRWWGGPSVDGAQCATIGDEVMEFMRSSAPRLGAFECDSHITCFEGEYDYMSASLAMVQRTPMGEIFRNATIHEGTCASMGYETVRDLVDDCWPMGSKHMHTETEDEDMQQWVFGPNGYHETLDRFDVTHSLPAGMAAALTSCFGCQAGGPNRDRGMLEMLSGSASNGGYNTEQCQALFNTACTQHPGALAQEMCDAGFSAVFVPHEFDPVPVVF